MPEETPTGGAGSSDDPLAPDDLASLPELNDDAVLAGIRARFAANKIYTQINSLLIAMNPYQQLPIYTPGAMAEYKAATVGALPPHVYGTAAAAYTGLLAVRSQSIVISGESGAGKSETAKKVLQHLAFAASRSGAQGDGIEARILASSPLLEAFGNAKTSMNNNSSRYGKFLMLNFDNSGTLCGANIRTYLLEKTRVVQQGNLERGYHIGYMLCQSAELAPMLGLPPARELQYLGQTGCLVSPGWDDAQELADCLAASDHLGISRDSRDRLWRIVASLLLLGELQFGPADAAEASIGDAAVLQKLCSLIEVDHEAMGRALTIKMTKMGADWIQAPNTPARASELRHGFARSIYSTCFDWLVSQINRSLKLHDVAGGGDASSTAAAAAAAASAADVDAAALQQFIGILDIFGFESFDVNSLEQLCINFCNERLQNTFNEAVFTSVQEENAAEGIELPEADFSEIDNGAVVKLIGGRPAGILHALNEECVVPKGTDQTMLDKLFEHHKANPLLTKPLKPREAFTVKHFVGPVTYLATNMLLKNKDPVSEDLMVLLQRSRSPFVQALFSSNSETKTLLSKKKETRFQGVAAKFSKQLDELLKLIGYSHMHFIRCIKPNRDKVPAIFIDELVVSQLKCSGVFEAVRVIGMGFPDRLPHFVIIGQFARLLPADQRPEIDEEGRLSHTVVGGAGGAGAGGAATAAAAAAVDEAGGEEGAETPKPRALTEAEAVADVLYKLGCVEGEFALGISKVFLKAGVLARLRSLQQQHMARAAVVIQAAARGRFARDRALVLREERQKRLEEEAAAARRAAMEAEAEARRAAAELEAAAAMERASKQAELDGAAATLSATRRSASAALQEVDHARSFMLQGGGLGKEGGLAESRWRRVQHQQMRLKLKAVAGLGGELFRSEEEEEQKRTLDESREARGLLSKRSQSRKNLSAVDPGGSVAGIAAGGKAGGVAGLGLKLNLTAAGLDASMLSHRDAGGGLAPLMSARAPVRKEVKKVSEKNKKDAKWMDMVLEYAVYLGMDPDEDGELLWIAEQALRAPVPEGWEEMMDPFGDLYFFNETTSQSTRQHPMDGYYQQLYRKMRLQRAGGLAGGELPPPPPPPPDPNAKRGGRRRSTTRRGSEAAEAAGRLADRASVASDVTGRRKSIGGALTKRGSSTAAGELSARGAGFLSARGGALGLSTARQGSVGMTARGDGGAPRHVISSVSEALEMSSPRSAKFMLDKFGLNAESTEDERCLLINPAIWRVPAAGEHVPFVDCVVEKDELGLGQSRLSLYICLNDNNEAYALGALKRMVNQNTMYELTMSENEEDVDVHYTGKLSCNPRGTEFVLYDDLNDAIGIREGKARRELGVILIGTRQMGQSVPIEFVIPRVQRDGATAQYRPTQLGEAMIQQYKSGRTKHLFVLRGLCQLVPGGRVQLKFRGGDHSAVVFEAFRSSGDRWTLRYRHPLSAFQAFNLAIAILHNQTTAMLDMLPPLDETMHAPAPTLSLALAPTNTLQHAYGVVYCLAVYGSRIFCGMHSGHLQQWQLPMNAPPTVIEWRAHSGTVYGLNVAGRSLVSASRDWLLRVWDLQSLTLVATLPGHRGAVRCLASSVSAPNLLYSGSNDKTVRVWDVATLQGGGKGHVLRGHRSWVRALTCNTDGSKLISAAKEVRVWSTQTFTLLHSLSVGGQVYCLAVCRASLPTGVPLADTLFAGCSRGRVFSWKLNELNARGNDQRRESFPSHLQSKIRALTCHGHVLLIGDQAGGVRAWDLSTVPAQGRSLDAHTAGVRDIDTDPITNLVFTAADDRCVKVWGEASFAEETRI